MKPLLHAEASVKRYGGRVEDYLPIHDFLDSTKSAFADTRHRAILHNSFGVFIVEKIFGTYINVLDGSGGWLKVSVRDIAEDHIVEDCGRIPSIQDWLQELPTEPWMLGKGMGARMKEEGYLAAYKAEKEDFNDQYRRLKKELSAKAKAVLLDKAKVFFEAVPIAKDVRWTQYTPYWCDGEACEFSVNDLRWVTNTEYDEEIEDHDYYTEDAIMDNVGSLEYYKKNIDKYDYRDKVESISEFVYEYPQHEAYIAIFKEFEKEFRNMDNDFMLDAFGDHVGIRITREGDCIVEDYEHD